MEKEIKKTIATKIDMSVSDSLNNIHNDTITVPCIQIDEKACIVKVQDSESKKKNVEYLTEKCRSIITNIQNKYLYIIISVALDNVKKKNGENETYS